MVSIHTCNSPHIWYIQIIMPFIDTKNNNLNDQMIISLFHLTNNIGGCFGCFLVCLIYLYSYISYGLPLKHTILCIFLFIFWSHIMSLKYLKGLHLPIWYHYTKFIYKNHT